MVHTSKRKSQEPYNPNRAPGSEQPPRRSPNTARFSSLHHTPRQVAMPGKLSCLSCPQFTMHLPAITITTSSASPAIPLQHDSITKAKTKPCKLQSLCLVEDTAPEKADAIICARYLLMHLHWGYSAVQLSVLAHFSLLSTPGNQLPSAASGD